MVIYNITFGVDLDIELEWLAWMKETHIPQVMSTGIFSESKIFKVVSHDDDASASYAIQYFAPTAGRIQEFLENHAMVLAEEVDKRFGPKLVSYKTVLEEV